jgi:hypothetical protein
MKTLLLRLILGCLALAGSLVPIAAQNTNAARGPDELFWVPTLEQALDMAKETGRPLFLMGYSLVSDGTTYTQFGDNACKGVF